MAWGLPKIGTATTVASGNVALTEPASSADGDLMIICIAARGNGAFTVPGTWNLVATAQNIGDTDATNGIASGVMMWRVRSGSANITINRTGGDVAIGVMLSYTGGHASPYDTGSSVTGASTVVTASTTGFNTAEAGELIVAMTAAGDTLTASAFDAATDPGTASGATDTTNAPTAGTWRERVDVTTGTGADTGLAIADAIRATAGATGTISATISGTGRHVMIAGAFKLGAPTISFAGSSAGTSTAAADLAITKNLAGSSAGTSTVVADLGITKNLSGSSVGVATASADLTVGDAPLELAGASSGTSTGTASLSITKNLSGSSLGGSTVGGTLLVTKNFSGSSAGSSSASAGLKTTKNLSGSSAGTSSAVADLNVEGEGIEFAGASAGSANASASLSITRNLSASAAGASTAAASWTITKNLRAETVGTTTLSATLSNTALSTYEEPYYATLNCGHSQMSISDGEGNLTLNCGINYLDLEALN